jgi:hypothetical protein
LDVHDGSGVDGRAVAAGRQKADLERGCFRRLIQPKPEAAHDTEQTRASGRWKQHLELNLTLDPPAAGFLAVFRDRLELNLGWDITAH